MLGREPGPPRELAGPLDSARGLVALAPYLPDLIRWSRVSVQSFARRFRDPFLRRHFALPFDLPDFPMVGVLMTLAAMHRGTAGYTVGGSLELARAVERRFLGLGGEIRYRSRVQKILVEDGRAVGVRLADGSEHRGGTVVSAADGHATQFDLLEGRYLTAEWRRMYEEARIFPPLVQVSLGVARDMSDQPHHVSFPVAPPILLPGGRLDRLAPQHYGFDPTMAPPGRSSVVTYLPSRHAPWKTLAADRDAYEAEKRRIGEAVIAAYDRRWPGFAAQVEVVDVATPLTYERLTGNWQGSFEGWLITTETMSRMLKGRSPAKTLPGLDRFHMIGQWTTPGGGLPPAAQDGRNLARLLCARDGRRFVTGIP
jgi:phytoene dehydrogenase-like protein